MSPEPSPDGLARDPADLTLRFERSTSEYLVREMSGDAAGSVATAITLSLLSDLDKKSREHWTPQDVKSTGSRLFEILFQGEILARLTSVQNQASSAGRTISLRLEFEGAEELDGLPWELLANPESACPFSLIRGIPTARPPQATMAMPLSILTAVASPTDLPPFTFDLEWGILKTALKSVVKIGRVSLDLLEEATETGLRKALAQQPFQVLHFVGYGRSNVRARYGNVLLHGQDTRSRAMTAEYLAGLLCQHPATRLVVLELSSTSTDFNPFAETARTLVRNGLDSVVAVRRRLSGPAAVAFRQELYSSLASGISIDQSMVNVRRVLAHCSDAAEWDAPMLYTSSVVSRVELKAGRPMQRSGPSRELDQSAGSAPDFNAEESHGTPPDVLFEESHAKNDRPEPRVPSKPPRKEPRRGKTRKITKILILAANPESLTRLRLEQEIREIKTGLRQAKYRDLFHLEPNSAVRTEDLHQAMLDFEPQIVHFCGHGAGSEGLILEDDNGLPRQVPSSALADLFRLFADKVECVVLNSCHTEHQAKAISEYIPYVVGMKKQIQDRAAIKFAIGFYRALGAGQSIDFAYQMGRNAIEIEDLPDSLMPVLLVRPSGDDQVS